MYLEMLAYAGDTLNYSIDRAFNESSKGTAQARESLIRIAQDLGFYNYFPKPSTTQAVLTITVPAVATQSGSVMTPDSNYLISLQSGLKVQSTNGTVFECLDEINFSNSQGRTIIPNFDTNNRLIDYTVEKTIVLTAGETRVQRFYVSANLAQPFLPVVINDTEVTEILGVVAVAGNTYDVPVDSDFRDLNKVYVEVENLSEDSIFVELNALPQDLQNLVNSYTDMSVSYGEWVNKPKRFIVRRTKDNQVILTFGSTLINYDNWNQLLNTYDVRTLANFSLNQILSNSALGEVPQGDSTLFIKYRTGAGTKTNILNNQIVDIVDKQFVAAPGSANLGILSVVKNSLKIASNLPAVGGTDDLTNEEIRHSIGKIFSANDRAVTYEDVKNLILKMPVKYGAPFRVSYEEIKPQVLTYSKIQNYLNTQLDKLLTLGSTADREAAINTIKQFMANLPTSSSSIASGNVITQFQETSNAILQNTTSLWIGEKCRLYVLGVNQDNLPVTIYKDDKGLWKYPNELLKTNIKNWLVTKRLIGDWIDIVDARVVNFQVQFQIIADKKNKQKVLIDCLTALRTYFAVTNWQINQPIYISSVHNVLQGIDGVVNVVNLRFYNIFDTDIDSGKVYSPKEIGRYRNNTGTTVNKYNNKFLMDNVNNVILSYPDTLLSIKFPDCDISGSVL
jgi:hypothetical protein